MGTDESYRGIQAAFKSFDVNSDGTISAENLREILTQYGSNSKLSSAEADEVISRFDKAGTGKLSIDELAKSMSGAITDGKAEALPWRSADPAERRRFAAFVRMQKAAAKIQSRSRGDSMSETELKEAFRVFDMDGNGLISASELSNIMRNLGEKLSDGEVAELIRQADIDRDGQINYEEFVKVMVAK